MEREVQRSVLRAIHAMHQNLGEQLTVGDIARSAGFSKFHFARVFREATGMSPGRFLSALRLQAAKQLLLSTSASIADISMQVGYCSVGTFSTRFKNSVGVAPSAYRAGRGRVPPIRHQAEYRSGTREPDGIRGTVCSPSAAADASVFLGLFPSVILEGAPARFTFLLRPGPYLLHDVPPGVWHILAHSVAPLREATGDRARHSFLGSSGPVTVRSGSGVLLADLRLRPARPLDPPVLIALAEAPPRECSAAAPQATADRAAVTGRTSASDRSR